MTEITVVPFINGDTEELLKSYGIVNVEDLDGKDATEFFVACCSKPEKPLAQGDKWKLWNAINLVKDYSESLAARFQLSDSSEPDFVSELMKVPNVTTSTVSLLVMAGYRDLDHLVVANADFLPKKSLEIVYKVQSMVELSPEETRILWTDVLAILVYALGYGWGWGSGAPGDPKYCPPA
jgi:hypothetical protein